MPDESIQQLLTRAVSLHQAGRLADAALLYQQIVTREPGHADALRLLGVIAHAYNKPDMAVALLRQAIAINATIPEYHNDLGLALQALGQLNEASEAYTASLRLRPDFAESHYNRGNLLKAQGDLEGALAAYREALRIRPDYAPALNNLANTLVAAGRAGEAIAVFGEAIRLQPRNGDWRGNLANALLAEERYAEAIPAYREALALVPQDYVLRRHYGDALQGAGRLDEALAEYKASLALNPTQPAAQNNRGTVLKMLDRLDDAEGAYRAALAIQRDHAEALSNLGSVLKDQARIPESLECFQKAAAASPGNVDLASNLIYMSHFDPARGPKELAAALAGWNLLFAEPLRAEWREHANDRSPDRPLRIGLVSPDFRKHPIGRFLAPLFAAHNGAAYEFHCFSDVKVPDAVTAMLREHAQGWHETRDLSHGELAERIRAERIDILIDLTMHMQNSRLLTFARKPAPVQMTYLAYASSTGLPAMDYRLTDAAIEGGGINSGFVEKPLFLESYWCYDPDPAAGEVMPSPVETAGFITFGNLNNFCKVSQPALDAWAGILQKTPDSRLLLHAGEGRHRARIQAMFAQRGIAAERIRFVGMLPFDRYLALYNEIDIALDPFPYAGGTTSCDALWMGVPLVTLAGRTGVGRGGVSLLTQLNLGDLVAASEADYQACAIALAADRARLAELRATLRARMAASRLTDRARFAADFQNALRRAWRHFCSSQFQ